MRDFYSSRTARMIDDQDTFEGMYVLGDDRPSLDVCDHITATSTGSRETDPDTTLYDEDADEAELQNEVEVFLRATDPRRRAARVATRLQRKIEARRLGGPAS